jgi:hypothetical protein
MPKPKKPTLKMYTISETVHICYQVVATSEEDAQEHYRNLDSSDFQQLLEEGASNNFCDDEVVDEEDYDKDEHSIYAKTDKAKEATK